MTTTIMLRQVLEDPTRSDLFSILNEYIRPESATTAPKAAALFAKSVKAEGESFFWRFWRSIFDVAEQIPHDNPAQDKLVAFLRDLKLVPETGEKVWEAVVWTELPLLGPSIREHIDMPAGINESISFHAFVARLLHAGVSPGSETTGIWMLRAALEEDVKPVSELDRALMIAAVYIEYAGATLVQELVLRPEPQLDATQQRVLRGGNLWTGGTGLTVDRWNFWGTRFRELGAGADSQEAKDLALHAARLIEVWSRTQLST
ncbi:hypothetical protein F4861DRAFT_210208 [Xylaria intraflava]|nr:hypothetical protein F4861DRAFT_210208 [Xylaria intraflava]